jgi:hypothetical protein
MTSWSLMILLIHLWLTAFIVLYFYSIDKNTRMYALFSLLFGPFSCSKTGRSLKSSAKPSNGNFITKIVAVCFGKKDNPSQIESTPSTRADIVQSSHKEGEVLEVLIDRVEIGVKTQEVTFDENETVVDVAEKSVWASRTYCDNKGRCQMPSHEVGTDAKRWREWIHTHVPRVVLFIIKLSWLLYNNIVVSATVVTVGYFTFVSICGYQFDSTWMAELGNLHRHGFNSVVAIIDLILLAYPVRILHFVYTASYGWIYALVTFFYWLTNTKENIVYEQIDYNKPVMVMSYYVLLTMMTFFMQMLHFFAYQLKLSLREKYLKCRLNCAKKGSVNCV